MKYQSIFSKTISEHNNDRANHAKTFTDFHQINHITRNLDKLSPYFDKLRDTKVVCYMETPEYNLKLKLGNKFAAAIIY